MMYLMFIRDLDDTDNRRVKEAMMLGLPHKSVFADEVQIGEHTIDRKRFIWSVFHDFPAAKMYSAMQEWVFPFIKNLYGDKESAYSKYMSDAIFKVPTPLMLDKIVKSMDVIYEQMAQLKNADTRGDLHLSVIRKTEINIEEYEKQLEVCGILDKVASIIDARKEELQKLDELIKARFAELFGTPVANDKGWKTASCKS